MRARGAPRLLALLAALSGCVFGSRPILPGTELDANDPSRNNPDAEVASDAGAGGGGGDIGAARDAGGPLDAPAPPEDVNQGGGADASTMPSIDASVPSDASPASVDSDASSPDAAAHDVAAEVGDAGDGGVRDGGDGGDGALDGGDAGVPGDRVSTDATSDAAEVSDAVSGG